MLNIDKHILENKRNLLAFSAGIDSSALFFLLIDNKIKFDIAIVDYGVRKESKEEVAHAKDLAKKYNLICHTTKAPTFTNNFEKEAREFRYNFFDTLMSKEKYANLLTAHQLNDQLEWFLMRLTKGAGVSELLGLQNISKRKNYTLLRPLLSYSKDELLSYLEADNLPYFIDQSNSDQKYERNRFRHNYSDALLKEHKDGIARSFDYLRKDKEILESGYTLKSSQKELRVITLHNKESKVRAVDITLKKLGYLLSASQREEIEKENSLVIGGKWAIEFQENLLYIAPFVKLSMPKNFKEKCRVAKIPSKIRGYIFKENILTLS